MLSYKRITLDPKTQIESRKKKMEKISYAKSNGKRAEVDVLMPDKINFKSEKFKRDKKGIILMKVSTQEYIKNSKHLSTYLRTIKIYEVKTDRIKGTVLQQQMELQFKMVN